MEIVFIEIQEVCYIVFYFMLCIDRTDIAESQLLSFDDIRDIRANGNILTFYRNRQRKCSVKKRCL